VAEYDAKIVVSADTRRADTSLDKLQAKLDQLAKTASGVGTGSIQGGIRAATQGIQNFGQEAKNVLSRGLFTGAILGVGQLSASISTATANLGPLTGAVKAAGSAFNSSLGGVPAIVGDILSQIGHIPNAMGLATVAAMAFAPQLLKASSAAVGLGSAIDKAIGAQTVTNIAGIVTGLNKVEETIKRTAAPMELLRAELSQAKQELDKYVSFTQESVVAANQLLAVEKMLTAEKRAQNALLGAVDPNAARRLQLQQRIARIRRGEEGGSAAFRESIARQAQIREAGSRSLYMRAEGRVALSEQSTAAAETARQIEKLNDRQRDFIARTDEAAQAANRQTAAFLRQQRIAKQVAALNLAAPAAQLMLPAAAPGSPAMSGGARRRITGPIERLGGARTLDEAQATLRLAQANTQLAQSTKKVDAEFNRFLPDTNLLNATARGIQRIQTNQEAFNESIARGIRFQEKLNREQERQRRLGIGVPSTTMPGTTGRTAGPFPVEGPIPLSQFGRRPQAAAPGRRGTNRLGGVVNNAIIGGAFPLLFGQGGGAATGGALGGAIGGLFGGTGGFAGSLLGTLIGSIASEGGRIKELAADIGFSADQTTRLQQAFKLAGQDADKFTEAVQNIRGVGLAIEDQAKAIDLVSVLTEKYGGNITKVTNALTGALESGKVTQATLNQLSSQGIDVQGALAEKYNTNRDAILKMAKDGKISVQDLIDVLVDMGNKGTNSVQKTASSFDNLKSAVGNLGKAFVSLGSAIVNALQPVLDWLGNRIADLVNIAADAIGEVGRLVETVARGPQAAARAQLKRGELPFGPQGVGDVIGQTRLQKLIKQAGPGNFGLGVNQKKLVNLLLEQPEFADLKPAPRPRLKTFTAPTQAMPTGDGGRAKGKSDADKLAEELQRSLEEGRKLSVEFSRQIMLNSGLSDVEKKRLQIVFDYQDYQKQISNLKNAEQRKSLELLNIDFKRQKNRELDLEITKESLKAFEKLAGLDFSNTENLGIRAFNRGAGGGNFRTDISFDPLNKTMQKQDEMRAKLKELTDPINAATTGAQAISGAFGSAFQSIISGAQSTEEALAGVFKNIGESFINMATEILAQMMMMFIFKQLLGLFGGGGGGGLFSGAGPVSGASVFGSGQAGFNPSAFGGMKLFADGGFVTGPTSAMVGEGGESEYIIPASKMRSAMSRYAAGARGSAVIPAGDDTSSGGGTATMAPAAIDVRYTVERINSVDYVTADQFRAGMAQAAQQGATQGEQRTLRRLQQSRATRSRLGMN
jgi:tape measure domain-containing protein